MKYNKSFTIVTILIGILIIIFLGKLIYSTWFENERTIQEVEVEPIANLNIQGDKINIIDLFKSDTDFSLVNVIASNGINKNTEKKQADKIKDYLSLKYKGKTNMEVRISSFYTSQDANKFYLEENQEMKKNDYGICEEKENARNKFFATYIVRLRTDPAGLSMLTNTYISYVVIQVNNLVIKIFEESTDRNISEKNRIIKLIADRLSKIK